MSRFRFALMLSGACASFAAPAAAHDASTAFLTLTRAAPERVEAELRLDLRDVEDLFGVDAHGDADGDLTWGELKAAIPVIRQQVARTVRLGRGTGACQADGGELLIDEISRGLYAVIRYAYACPTTDDGAPYVLDYSLLVDQDAQHRCLVRWVDGDQSIATVMSPTSRRKQFAVDPAGAPNAVSPASVLADYAWNGVSHIATGYDHLLFLALLVFAGVYSTTASGRAPQASFRGAFRDTLITVTAFTAAHSLTLVWVTLEGIQLSSRWVETTIAASIIVAAANNIRPFLPGRAWVLAFGFGLVHGCGFASELIDLGLSGKTLATALLGFNVGVELGQAAGVAVLLPLCFAIRRAKLYRPAVLVGGSVAAALLAAVWMAERAFDVPLIGF